MQMWGHEKRGSEAGASWGHTLQEAGWLTRCRSVKGRRQAFPQSLTKKHPHMGPGPGGHRAQLTTATPMAARRELWIEQGRDCWAGPFQEPWRVCRGRRGMNEAPLVIGDP